MILGIIGNFFSSQASLDSLTKILIKNYYRNISLSEKTINDIGKGMNCKEISKC